MKNILYTFCLALMTLLVLSIPAVSADNNDFSSGHKELTVIDTGPIKEVLRSDMVMLNDDKRFRLDNILIPPYEDPPAIDELNKAFLNQKVTVYTYLEEDEDRDRYGVLLAHIVTDKGVWVQEDLVSKGLAWAFISEKSPEMADLLKPIEEKARQQHLGFWQNPAYAIKTPLNIKECINSYQIVEGRVQSVYVKPNTDTAFFNFGKTWKGTGGDWKTDFTVRVQNEYQFLPLLKDPSTGETNIRPADWKGRFIRVRGWVTDDHGPVIEVTHKQQIDILPSRSDDDQ